MNDVAICMSRRMQGMIHDACVHEVIGQEARHPRKRHHEVPVGVHAHPEGAAVVPEEVVLDRHQFFSNDAAGRGGSRVDPKPLVPRPGEALYGKTGRRRDRRIDESTCDNDARAF